MAIKQTLNKIDAIAIDGKAVISPVSNDITEISKDVSISTSDIQYVEPVKYPDIDRMDDNIRKEFPNVDSDTQFGNCHTYVVEFKQFEDHIFQMNPDDFYLMVDNLINIGIDTIRKRAQDVKIVNMAVNPFTKTSDGYIKLIVWNEI